MFLVSVNFLGQTLKKRGHLLHLDACLRTEAVAADRGGGQKGFGHKIGELHNLTCLPFQFFISHPPNLSLTLFAARLHNLSDHQELLRSKHSHISLLAAVGSFSPKSLKKSPEFFERVRKFIHLWLFTEDGCKIHSRVINLLINHWPL